MNNKLNRTFSYKKGELFRPVNDLIFKKLFGSEKNKESLMSFLNTVIDAQIDNVDQISIYNTEISADSLISKNSRYDLCYVIKKENKEHIIIEMQLEKLTNNDDRFLHYLTQKHS